jgi:hypothetical protein
LNSGFVQRIFKSSHKSSYALIYLEIVMNKTLDCPHAAPSLPLSPWLVLGRFWRRLAYSNHLDPNTLSTHMRHDLGLPSHSVEDPLAKEKLRNFF